MNFSVPPPMHGGNPNVGNQFQSLQFKPFKAPDGEFDGKRLRKSVMRKTVDYNSSVVQMLEARIWQRDYRDRPSLPADICYASHLLPPPAYLNNPMNSVVTKFVRTSTNKAKCPIFCLAWTPEGRRLVTGASSGEFTLWNGLTFNFETILQAHEKSVREMVWSHNDQWMVTGDTDGYVKYWQSNMNNVLTFQAHKDPVRGLSFCPKDVKLASGSDDGTVRIWDFHKHQEERTLKGHGADVKCVAWHPSKSLLASGSKDNQQPIKLWDPRCGTSLAKLNAHKGTVMDLKWNPNGNWLCSASRDHLLKLFDVRNFSTELQVFRGHKKEASCIAWHPQHEGMFASGGSDGSILFWLVGNDKEVGMIESAHDGIIWDLAWHPLGHILCSGSNDHASKFWTRNRVGDKMRDKYNLNTLPPGVIGDDCVDIDDIPTIDTPTIIATIPGMGPDDKVDADIPETKKGPEVIPGLEFDSLALDRFLKKTPYAKPIPKTFQAAWNAAGGLDESLTEDQSVTSWVVVESEGLFSKPAEMEGDPVHTEIGERLPAGSVPLEELKADAIAYFGFYIPMANRFANEINDAFAFCEEEEAINVLTEDPEFARKLIREKKGLYNPAANPGFEEVKQEDRKRYNDDGGNRNRNRDSKNFERRDHHRSSQNSQDQRHSRSYENRDRGFRKGRSPPFSGKGKTRGRAWEDRRNHGDIKQESWERDDRQGNWNRNDREPRERRNWNRREDGPWQGNDLRGDENQMDERFYQNVRVKHEYEDYGQDNYDNRSRGLKRGWQEEQEEPWRNNRTDNQPWRQEEYREDKRRPRDNYRGSNRQKPRQQNSNFRGSGGHWGNY